MQVLKQLQKEFAAYNEGKRAREKEFVIDVYSDRVVIQGDNRFVESFFSRREVVACPDRGGWAILTREAKQLGLELAIGTHVVQYSDMRKKAIIKSSCS